MHQTKKKSVRLKDKIGRVKFRLKELQQAIAMGGRKSGLSSSFAKHSYAILQKDKSQYVSLCQLLLILESTPMAEFSQSLSLALG